MNKSEGLFLVQDDNGIRRLLSKINPDIDVIEFFADHEIDALVLAQDILAIGYSEAVEDDIAPKTRHSHGSDIN